MSDHKRIAILVEFNYEDLEVHYPALRFKEEGWDVLLVGPKEAGFKYAGKNGYPCTSTHSITQVSADDIDALIIPGGWAPDYWRRDERFLSLTRAMMAASKPVASICHGPWLLVSAGVLKGRTATCFVSIKDDVINAGATYVDAEVVVDGNLITSRVPSDLPAFCKAILAALRAPAPASTSQ